MDVENVIYIFAYNFANVGMKPVCKGWNIFVHLYNKKVLKYGEQDVIFVNLVWVIVEVPLVYKVYSIFWRQCICIIYLFYSPSFKRLHTAFASIILSNASGTDKNEHEILGPYFGTLQKTKRIHQLIKEFVREFVPH